MPRIDQGLVAHSLNVERECGTKPVVQLLITFDIEVEAQIT
jgi:hypothetical protein